MNTQAPLDDRTEIEPPHGVSVVTADGKRVGKVIDTQDHYFKVRGGLFHSYWLADDGIKAIGENVMLAYPKDELDEFKLASPYVPDPEGARMDAREDALFSEQEREEQRERVERELAEQRKQLPH